MRSPHEPIGDATARRRPRGGMLAVALLVALAGCAGGRSGVVYNSSFTAGYDPFSVSAALSRAPLLVETYVSPAAGVAAEPATGVATESVNQATVQGLRRHGPSWFPRNFTGSPTDAGNGPYRLRIAYNLPQSFNRQLVCSSTMDAGLIEAARGQGDQASTRTLASFCRGETTLSSAEGSPGSAVEVGGEDFSRFVGRLGRAVMPRRNPELDDDCLFRFCD